MSPQSLSLLPSTIACGLRSTFSPRARARSLSLSLLTDQACGQKIFLTHKPPVHSFHDEQLGTIMEPVCAAIPGGGIVTPGISRFYSTGMDDIKLHLDEIVTKVDKLEERVTNVEQFYLNQRKKQPNASKGSSSTKDSKEKVIVSIRKQQQEALRREAAAAKRMQELMRQFGTMLHQIIQHRWARPFMNPVDVEGLGLHDYYQVIDRPMDFNTIKNQMEEKDGTGYKHVREICADVRLVFKNAMKYNEERSDVHVMAKTLMAKFEEKWLQLLPKVAEEEKRFEEEEKVAQEYMQLAREAAQARTAQELSSELYEIEMHLEQLRDAVMQNCRKISNEEKRKLGAALAQLSAEDLHKALEIVAQNNPSFQSKTEIVNLEIDAQSESTLWRLRFFVKEVMEGQGKRLPSVGGNNATINNNNLSNNNSKRKREIADAIPKTTKKKSKKPSL